MRRALIPLLVVGCVFVASCVDRSGTGGPESAAADGTRTAPDRLGRADDLEPVPDRSEREADATGALPTDGVLRLGLIRPESYLPAEVALTDQSAVILADLLYDGLTEAVGSDGRLGPGLAQAWWPDDAYRSWTFSLDPTRGVSAETVVASLRPLASTYVGPDPRPGVPARLAGGIRSVAVVDPLTVTIELDRSNAGLPWVLSGLPFSIVGADAAATGDYRIVSDDSAGLRLVRRSGGDIELAGGAELPTVGSPDSIRVTWLRDIDEGVAEVAGGAVHGAVVPPAAPDSSGTGMMLVTSSVASRFYVVDRRSPGVGDPATAALVRAAIDTDALLVAAGDDAQVNDGLVPSAMAGYRTGACGPACTGADAAGSTEAVPVEPIEVTFAAPEQETTAEALAGQLAAAGIPAQSIQRAPEDLAAVIVGGGSDLFAFGWVAAATSVDAVLPPLLTVDSPANIARIESATVDRLLAAASVTADDELRWDLLDEAHRAALADGWIIPVPAAVTGFGTAPEAAGWLTIRADGSLDLGGS